MRPALWAHEPAPAAAGHMWRHFTSSGAKARAPHQPLIGRIWELRDDLTPYDAAYVALAEALEAPLLTADRRLARAAGAGCEVELLG